ncbi:MAG: hypothetical protein ABI411_10765 [Tahibacter sp.]
MFDEAEICALQELTPSELERICGAGAGYDYFPHSASLDPLPLFRDGF